MNYCEDSLKILDKNLLEFKKSIIKRIKFPKDIRNYELALIWNSKGVIHLNIHQYAEALECFNNVTELNPERGMSWNSKAYALAKLKRYDEALKCVNKSIELNTDSDFLNAAALDSKGYILAGLGKLEEALEYHQNAIKMDPQAEEKYYNKGKTHVKLQQYSEALECFDKALELNPYCEAAKKARNEVLKITNI